MTAAIDLTVPQQIALRAAFLPFAAKIRTVGVYGSRAQGTARPGSDVDLVVYGEVTADDIESIAARLDEGDLSIFADVVDYDAVVYPPLKAQIDRWMLPLFTQTDLVAG